MANATQAALTFGNANRLELWNAAYQNDVNNIYWNAKGLTKSVSRAIHYADRSDHETGVASS